MVSRFVLCAQRDSLKQHDTLADGGLDGGLDEDGDLIVPRRSDENKVIFIGADGIISGQKILYVKFENRARSIHSAV